MFIVRKDYLKLGSKQQSTRKEKMITSLRKWSHLKPDENYVQWGSEERCCEGRWKLQEAWRWEEQSRYQDPETDKLSWESEHTVEDNQKSKRPFPHNPCFGHIYVLINILDTWVYTVFNISQTMHLLYSIWKLYFNLNIFLSIYLIPFESMSSLLCPQTAIFQLQIFITTAPIFLYLTRLICVDRDMHVCHNDTVIKAGFISHSLELLLCTFVMHW